jgi:presenilin-like A22 family membrane protease
MGAGAAALFGISFGLLPALVLLSVLAVYDAISVYGTEHMLDLAEGVMDLKIPVVLVVPMTLSYSYLAAGSTDDVLEDGGAETAADGEATDGGAVEDGEPAPSNPDTDTKLETDAGALDRDALFIGLGDAVIPTILVASAAAFLDVGVLAVPGITLNLPALGASLGTIAGLLVLMYMVLEGRAHAGLPLLNGGAIGGYLLGALASGLSLAAAIGF